MAKRNDPAARLQGSPHPALKSTPSQPTGTREHDARNDESKLKENRDDLGVTPDHKTEEMEKADRGTFP